MATVTYSFSSDGHSTVSVEGEFEDASETVKQIRDEGVFSILKFIGEEFKNAPLAGLESVQVVVPEAEQISDEARTAATVERMAGERADGYVDSPRPVQPVGQSFPPCNTCGAPTTYHKGSKNGVPWEAYFCSTGTRDHTHFIKR